jgi:hypothetical protein
VISKLRDNAREYVGLRSRAAKSIAAVCAVSAMLFVAPLAQAAPNKLQTFGTGDVAATGDAATINNDPGEYGGVYLKSRSQSAKLTEVAFSFTSSGDVAGGAPRFSIPIDTDNNGSTDNGYAFLDVLNCGSNVVSTDSANCQVFFNNEITGYANWAAFAAAHPTWRIAPGGIPFIISDQPGNYVVNNIVLR